MDNYYRSIKHSLDEWPKIYNTLTRKKQKEIDSYFEKHIENRNQGISMFTLDMDEVIPFPRWVNDEEDSFRRALLNRVSAIYGEGGHQFRENIYTPRERSPRSRGGSKKTYKGKQYTVRTGPKGGTYILVNGIKRYISP